MPSKKKKYNARFPSGRIKKIMQTDEEIGKVAQAVPVIISRTLELFVKSLLTKAMAITAARNAKTLTPSHMKQCILSESRFDFLKDLVKALPDATTVDGDEPCTPTSNLSISNNFNPAAERRQADRSLRNSRQSSETQPRSSSFRNGAGPNFYIENTEACPSFRSTSNEYHPSSSVSGPVDESEEEESEEETKPTMTIPATFPSLAVCTQVDEDYDT